MKLGVALGGGGAKGLAHIGVLEALEENGIMPNFVAGTSIGSIVGAMYCISGSTKGLREKAKKLIQTEEFRNLELSKFYTDAENIFERFKKELFEKFYLGTLLFKKSHSRIDATRKLYRDLFGDKRFEDSKIDFACNALDIQSGEETIFKTGSIAEAVWASCAIPGIFPPFVKAKRIFVDGGVVNNIPIEPVKKIGAKIVLAIYLGSRPRFSDLPNTGFQINQRSYYFMRYYHDQRILKLADFVIRPEVAAFHWADFTSIDTYIQRGREAVVKNLKEIKLAISFWHQLTKFLRRNKNG